MKIIYFIYVFFIFTMFTFADSWAPAENFTIFSQNKKFKAEIFVHSYHKPVAVIDSLSTDSNKYTHAINIELTNKRSPVEALLSNSGSYLITFDDYGNLGVTKNTIVIYDLQLDTIIQYPLSHFVTRSQMNNLPHSVSSIWWRGEVKLNTANDTVLIHSSFDDDFYLNLSYKVPLLNKSILVIDNTDYIKYYYAKFLFYLPTIGFILGVLFVIFIIITALKKLISKIKSIRTDTDK